MVHSFAGFEGVGGGGGGGPQPPGALFFKSGNLKKKSILVNFHLMENPKIL
jgi:hypothetical protein